MPLNADGSFSADLLLYRQEVEFSSLYQKADFFFRNDQRPSMKLFIVIKYLREINQVCTAGVGVCPNFY